MTQKILVCGDVEGRFGQLFQRVSTVHQKNGPFEMLLCVGNFYGSEGTAGLQPYLTGTSKVPIPTYILGPSNLESVAAYENDSGAELCTNLTYLGKNGSFTSAAGLKLVYFSGMDSHSKGDAHGKWTFTSADEEQLRNSITFEKDFQGVDVLLTSCWPRDVTSYVKAAEQALNASSSCGSVLISRLALAVRPRYHFCGTEDVFYERLPYRNHRVLAEATQHITRFVALAKVGNPAKAKWLYGFSIIPLVNMERSELVKQPQDVTECPYQSSVSSESESMATPTTQFFFDMEVNGDRPEKRRWNDRGPRNDKRSKPRMPNLDSCWFCLSSPKVEKHLVVSVGEHNYLALPKGGLVPDHIMILPISHCQAVVGLDPEALEEIESFKEALEKFFRSQDKSVVFFERNYKTGHLQIQAVPVPFEKSGNIKRAFLYAANANNINLDEIPKHSDLRQIFKVGVPYFYVELPSKEKLIHRIRGQFPLQFGREVLASAILLNVPEKSDWRSCNLGTDQETRWTTDFRKAFAPFDFTLS